MRVKIIVAATLVLAGCGRAENMVTPTAQRMVAYDVAEPEEQMRSPAPNSPAAALIAYTYSLTYRLADTAVAPLQIRHTALCTSLGPTRCRVVTSSLRSGDQADGGAARFAGGETKFLVDARIARAFIAKLDEATTGAGGTVADRQVDSEDVTKQVVDTDARVRAKQALADRLMKLIGSANAKVGDLVEAERAFAQTQEELDAARSLQAALRQRVAMSEVSVGYTSTAAENSWGEVGERIASAGGTLAASVATLITFVVAALPWILLLALLIWIARRRGWRLRWPWRRREEPPQP